MIVSKGNGKTGFLAEGMRVLKKEDMTNWLSLPNLVDPNGVSFELGETVLEVEEDFFALTPTLDELIIRNSNCNVRMLEQTIQMFQENNVLLRGKFDSSAEHLAKEVGLRFLHEDERLACYGDASDIAGVDIITLCFNSDGSGYIHLDNYSGTSSGEITYDLPEEFYLRMDAKTLADEYGFRCKEEIKNSKTLDDLLSLAKAKGGFLLNDSKDVNNY